MFQRKPERCLLRVSGTSYLYGGLYRVALVSQAHLLPEIHRHETPTNLIRYAAAEVTPGQWVMGHGSNGSTNLDGLRGSSVDTCKPLTGD